jgi:hypothetical protein
MSTLLRKKLKEIGGPRKGITLYGDGETGFDHDKLDVALRHIVEMTDAWVARGEKRCAEQDPLMERFRKHPEWADMSAYRIYEYAAVNIQKIKRVMASDEFKEWKASLIGRCD